MWLDILGSPILYHTVTSADHPVVLPFSEHSDVNSFNREGAGSSISVKAQEIKPLVMVP